MVDTKDRTGVVLMVGLNNRFINHAYFTKNYIDAGNLGEIYHAKCGWVRRRGIPHKGGWSTNKNISGGGPLIDLAVHYMDLTMFFMGIRSRCQFPWQPLQNSGITNAEIVIFIITILKMVFMT